MQNNVLNEVLATLKGELAASAQAREAQQERNLGVEANAWVDLLVKDQRMRKVIDAACDMWIANGDWPLMPPDEAELIYVRLQDAYEFAQSLQRHGFFASDAQQALRFLVIDNWALSGARRLGAL